MKFDREGALGAALKLLNRDGLEKLTMRALANELGVQAPSLYYYFPSKQELLDAIADGIAKVALKDVDRTVAPNALPREMARKLRHALLSIRDGAKVYSGSYSPTPNVMGFSDLLVSALIERGLGPAAAVHTAFNLVYYVVGCAMEEQAFTQKWGGADKVIGRNIAELKLRTESLSGYPALTRCLDVIIEADFDTRFDLGVQGLLMPPGHLEAAG